MKMNLTEEIATIKRYYKLGNQGRAFLTYGKTAGMAGIFFLFFNQILDAILSFQELWQAELSDVNFVPASNTIQSVAVPAFGGVVIFTSVIAFIAWGIINRRIQKEFFLLPAYDKFKQFNQDAYHKYGVQLKTASEEKFIETYSALRKRNMEDAEIVIEFYDYNGQSCNGTVVIQGQSFDIFDARNEKLPLIQETY